MISSVTASRLLGAAVQHPLDGEVDIVSLVLAGDFDTIRERADGTVSPAGPAVVGDVLVEVFGEVGDAIDVVPCEAFGDLF